MSSKSPRWVRVWSTIIRVMYVSRGLRDFVTREELTTRSIRNQLTLDEMRTAASIIDNSNVNTEDNRIEYTSIAVFFCLQEDFVIGGFDTNCLQLNEFPIVSSIAQHSRAQFLNSLPLPVPTISFPKEHIPIPLTIPTSTCEIRSTSDPQHDSSNERNGEPAFSHSPKPGIFYTPVHYPRTEKNRLLHRSGPLVVHHITLHRICDIWPDIQTYPNMLPRYHTSKSIRS
ncbi:uncharacterized protein EAF01_009447 [Botrytis porri]|uniref:uncharacterized protein n=1 Tax=Botrytis porri TaxID=87229 RepID=UPI00190063EF|nr:uncharacterized protein EAF01_009447 [Botrytis porri]KAF7895485.1 hypothetical protein EAF01_009447 [Botrytis porri]